MDDIRLIKTKISRTELQKIAETQFGDLVKAVVDVRQGIMAVGGDLHADEEEVLIEQGSQQSNLWGINLYPGEPKEKWIEFDSVINIRPSSGNRSRGVDDPKVREEIVRIVNLLVE